jgi:hypothetical protein
LANFVTLYTTPSTITHASSAVLCFASSSMLTAGSDCSSISSDITACFRAFDAAFDMLALPLHQQPTTIHSTRHRIVLEFFTTARCTRIGRDIKWFVKT